VIARWAAASVRARLTAWYAVVLAVMLIVYAAVTFLAVRHAFFEQLDEQLHEEFETAEERLTRLPDGRIGWSGGEAAHEDGREARVYEAWSAAGERLHRSGTAAPLPPLALPLAASRYRYETILAGAEAWRSLSAPVDVGGRAVVLRVSRPEAPVQAELREVLAVLLFGLPLVVALAGVGGYVLARRALRPIDDLAADARRISADRLHARLSVPNQHDEIGRLAAVFNDTLARLEASFEQLRRFTADASHELRTPLAVVRGVGEATLANRRTAPEYEEAIGGMLEEIDRLSTLVDTLLRLSRGDAGTIRLSREPVDLAALARDVAASLAVLAEERRQTVSVTAEPVVASVDRLVVREALASVLDNAIKYSPDGTPIEIGVCPDGDDHAVIAVADRGPGVAAEHRGRIFDRFFRVDEGRSRDHGGAGLGLAIARWAVEIHGGAISVEPRAGGGAEFRLRLPLAASPAGQA
jgi:heavy metal sensor kinase